MSARLWEGLAEVLGRGNASEHRDRGFILIVVISALGLLALVAANFANVSRSHVRAASAAVGSAIAEQLADAGIQLAVLDLVAATHDRGHRWRFAVDGSAIECDAGDGNRLRISVQDEAGKVDLNAADEPLLRALLLGLGIDGPSGSTADRIIDFRDTDSIRRPQGAELPEYLAASRQQGPKNAPFAVVDEVQQVLGFSAADAARLRPHITVYSGQSSIAPTAASAELIAILSRGHWQLAPAPADAAATEPLLDLPSRLPASFVGASGGRFFAVRSQAHTGGAIFVREAVVEVGRSRIRPFTFLRWYRGAAVRQEPELGLLSCWR